MFEYQEDGPLKMRDIDGIGPVTVDNPWNLPPGPKPWNLLEYRSRSPERCEEGYHFLWEVLMQEKMEREGYSRDETHDAIYGNAKDSEKEE